MAVHVFLVVALDVVQVVDVIHHHSERLREALGRGVRAPVDALQPRAVAQVETRHGIEGPYEFCSALS